MTGREAKVEGEIKTDRQKDREKERNYDAISNGIDTENE